MAMVITHTDAEDQAWLDERISAARSGIEAVIEIAQNWEAGRMLSRLHPGSAADYVREHVGILSKAAVVALLENTDLSNRQIAKVAGVSPRTVNRAAAAAPTEANASVERPATTTLGADGKRRKPRATKPKPEVPPIEYVPDADEQPLSEVAREYIKNAEAHAQQSRIVMRDLMQYMAAILDRVGTQEKLSTFRLGLEDDEMARVAKRAKQVKRAIDNLALGRMVLTPRKEASHD
jgi:hypothetical protein